MAKFQLIYFRLVPLFSAIFLIYWSYEAYENLNCGNIDRMKLNIFIAVLFAIAFIISLVYIFISKKNNS